MIRYIFILFIFSSFYILSDENNYLWEIALSGKVILTPIERKNGELLLICDDRRLYSLDSKLGTINWKIKPGGRLDFLEVSPDGSIIVKDEKNIYSYYGNGELRWSLFFPEGFSSNLTISERGDLIVSSGQNLYLVDRFSKKNIILKDFKGNTITYLNNSLIAYVSDNRINTVSYSGKFAWEKNISREPNIMKSFDDNLYLAYDDGEVEQYSFTGEFIYSWPTTNIHISSLSLNFKKNIIISGDYGTTLLTEKTFMKNNSSMDIGLYYSNGILIKSQEDWLIHGLRPDNGLEYYPSGQIQFFKRDISLSNKIVWGDELYREYFQNIILSGNRTLQSQLLKKIELEINSVDILDKYPNMYEILLLTSSKQNINQDIRQEAYRIIGLSKDLSFLPYLIKDLEVERSYIVIPYIYYALGQIGVDINGGVINVINSRLDDYFDEKLAINGLHALYNINYYTNDEFIYIVFSGIEKILNGGYSRNIQNQCYEIIKKIK